MRRTRKRTALLVAAVTFALAAFAVPAGAIAAAEQIVIALVDEPAPWEFDDPCTGEALHGIGIENGTVRITELGDKGHHVRLNVHGTADLFDDSEDLVGTWTYHLTFTDEFPPGGQGAVHMTASGPLVYEDGHSAIIHVAHHHVFDKGDVEKFPARDTATCGGKKS